MKKSIMYAAIFCAVLMGAVSMIGCKTTGATGGTNLAGTWNLYEVSQGKQVIQIPEITGASLTFADNSGNVQISGFAGVNNLSGVAKINGSSISFGALATTMMAGSAEDEIIESSVVSLLNDAKSFSVSGNVLKIVAKNGDAMYLKKFTLADSAWLLFSYNDGNAVVSIPLSTEPPMLEFDADGNLSGSTGVNNLMGTYSLDDLKNKVSFKGIGTTRMAPRDADAAALEKTFVSLLGKVAKYNLSGNLLVLCDAKDNTLLSFEKK